jgi:hypothetical protein
MIEDIQRLEDKVKWVQDNIHKVLNDVLESLVKEILDMNTQGQLYDVGITTKGVSLESIHAYRPLTIQIKTEKGQKVSNITLKDTGEFYSDFGVQFFEDGFRIVSDNWKTVKLQNVWGKEIFGLTDESIGKLRKLVKEPLIATLNDRIRQN